MLASVHEELEFWTYSPTISSASPSGTSLMIIQRILRNRVGFWSGLIREVDDWKLVNSPSVLDSSFRPYQTPWFFNKCSPAKSRERAKLFRNKTKLETATLSSTRSWYSKARSKFGLSTEKHFGLTISSCALRSIEWIPVINVSTKTILKFNFNRRAFKV